MELPPIPKLDLSKIPPTRIALVGGAIVVLVTLLVFLRLYARPGPSTEGPTGPQGALTLWGVLPENEMQALLSLAQGVNSGVTVSYRRIDESVYEDALIEALAAGEGPDVFMVSNHDMPKNGNKIAPLPAGTMDIHTLRELYPYVVEQEMVLPDGMVYGLPFYIDTLGMIYNKELFDQAGVASPPRTWEEFARLVPRMRVVSPTGQVVRAAAAIGGSENTIDTAVDILNLIMLQNGAEIIAQDLSRVKFDSSEGANSGLSAFNFYVQFANAGSPLYTWSERQGNHVEQFISGNVAIIFDYYARLGEIKARAPFLRTSTAPMPQLGENRVNYARYWTLAVSKQSKGQDAAFAFVRAASANEGVARSYFEQFGRPPALGSLTEALKDYPDIGAFIGQTLTARSWYNPDERLSRDAFSRGIDRVRTGLASPQTALGEISEILTQALTLRRASDAPQ